MPSTSTPTSTSIAEVRQRVRGRVIEPGDPDYDEMRQVAFGADRRPAAIVRVADASDVATVVTFARETGTELAVRSGGHSSVGHGVSDGGVVIDLREMKGLEIDVESRTAWAETGLTAEEYSQATAEHGLATGFGDTGSVGIGGITLGGGIGYLVRKYGMTIDSLLAADVVTADGELVRADETSHPDLFWAIRGGGGNFGVATRFRFRLQPVPSIVGGVLMLPASGDVLHRFLELADEAPDELSTIANVMPAPPMPIVPRERVGELAIFALMVYAGETAAGERVLAPFRALATPIVDRLREMAYPGIYSVETEDGGADEVPAADRISTGNEADAAGEDDGAGEGFHPTVVARQLFTDRIHRGTADMLVERLRSFDAPMRFAQIRVLGGAMARVPVDSTAFAHRQSRTMVIVGAFSDSPDDLAERERWTLDLAAALTTDDTGAYVNFLGDEGEERIRAAYPGGTWKRLAAIKARYDPTNLFRLNQNIPPMTEPRSAG